MMEFVPNLLGLAAMHILMAMLPGPNTVIVSWFSATRSRSDGMKAVAGVVLASLIWVSLSLFGVGTLLLEAGWLYRALRLAGALYLMFVGVQMFRAGLGSLKGTRKDASKPVLNGRGPFATGLTTTLSNPKSAIFWTSAFLVAVPSHAPAWVYAVILVIVAVQSSLWYGGLAMFFSLGFASSLYQRTANYLDFLTSGVMVALGLKVADEVRREITAAAS